MFGSLWCDPGSPNPAPVPCFAFTHARIVRRNHKSSWIELTRHGFLQTLLSALQFQFVHSWHEPIGSLVRLGGRPIPGPIWNRPTPVPPASGCLANLSHQPQPSVSLGLKPLAYGSSGPFGTSAVWDVPPTAPFTALPHQRGHLISINAASHAETVSRRVNIVQYSQGKCPAMGTAAQGVCCGGADSFCGGEFEGYYPLPRGGSPRKWWIFRDHPSLPLCLEDTELGVGKRIYLFAKLCVRGAIVFPVLSFLFGRTGPKRGVWSMKKSWNCSIIDGNKN